MVPIGLDGQRKDRLVEWCVDVLARQLQRVVAMRCTKTKYSKATIEHLKPSFLDMGDDATVLDEVREIIQLSNETKEYQKDPDMIDLGEAVVSQLRQFVSNIADMYHPNSFHCFGESIPYCSSVTE